MFHSIVRRFADYWKARRMLCTMEAHPVLGPVLAYLRQQQSDATRENIWVAVGGFHGPLALELLRDIEQAVHRSPNPVQGVRRRLFDLMHEAAKYQVLIMDRRPEAQDGLPFYDGVSGQLKALIPDLAKVDEGLQSYFYRLSPSPQTAEEMFKAVYAQHAKLNTWVNAFNVARFTLRDFHADARKDWFKPCYVSLCIWHDSLYRQALKMPSALTAESAARMDLKVLAHSLWLQVLESSSTEPRLDWERKWTELFGEPSPSSSPDVPASVPEENGRRRDARMILTRANFQALSRMRRREARILLNGNLFAGAYYLTGYSVECALKACIARGTARYTFPDKQRTEGSDTHDLAKLLATAGLQTAFDVAAKARPALEQNWATVKDWKETSRYDATIDPKKARDLYGAVTGRNGVLAWLRQNW
jgi:hypothetical protein